METPKIFMVTVLISQLSIGYDNFKLHLKEDFEPFYIEEKLHYIAREYFLFGIYLEMSGKNPMNLAS